MLTVTEQQEARDKLAADIVAIKTSGEAHTGQILEIQQSLELLKQTQEAYNRAAQASSLGEDGESLYYSRAVTDDEKAQAPDSYLDDGDTCLRVYGHDVDMGNGTTYRVHGLLDDVQPLDEAQANLQKAVAERRRVRQMLRVARFGKDAKDPRNVVHTPQQDGNVRRAVSRMPAGIRRIFADLNNFGDDFKPLAVDPAFERELLAAHTFANAITQMNHPGGTLTIPAIEGALQAYCDKVPSGDDPANSTLSSLGTDADTVVCKDMSVGSQLHRRMTEQSVAAIQPVQVAEHVRAHSFADDNFFVNGNVFGSLRDTAIATWNVRGRMGSTDGTVDNQLFMGSGGGLREHAFADSATVDLGSAQDYDGALSLLQQLDIEVVMDTDGRLRVVFMVPPEFFFSNMVKWAEFSTFDKAGSLATILSGTLAGRSPYTLPNQVGYLLGRFPVCLCYTITRDLNAAGIYDGTTTTKTGILAADVTRYQRWTEGGLRVESELDIRNNTVTLVSRQARTMRRTQANGQKSAAWGFNLTPGF